MFGTIVGVATGYVIGNLYPEYRLALGQHTDLKLAAILGGLGYLICSLLTREVETWFRSWSNRIDMNTCLMGAAGAVTGLTIANLFIIIPLLTIFWNTDLATQFAEFSFLVPLFKLFAPLMVNLAGLYAGVTIFVRNRTELTEMLARAMGKSASVAGEYRILDTSVIIDGRILDIFKTGFLHGRVLIPKFVLSELQLIADSHDQMKRSRGRRGLDIANALISESGGAVTVHSKDFEEVKEVDSKLVELARFLNGAIVTNDYNLNKIASIQGIAVLNVNDLSNAIKPLLIPGDRITVSVAKAGKEEGQGVGYMNDGTMIVIDRGSPHVGRLVTAVVDSVLQTSAGRMIFAALDKVEAEEKNIFEDTQWPARKTPSSETPAGGDVPVAFASEGSPDPVEQQKRQDQAAIPGGLRHGRNEEPQKSPFRNSDRARRRKK